MSKHPYQTRVWKLLLTFSDRLLPVGAPAWFILRKARKKNLRIRIGHDEKFSSWFKDVRIFRKALKLVERCSKCRVSCKCSPQAEPWICQSSPWSFSDGLVFFSEQDLRFEGLIESWIPTTPLFDINIYIYIVIYISTYVLIMISLNCGNQLERSNRYEKII